jgi:hypothetical protein
VTGPGDGRRTDDQTSTLDDRSVPVARRDR